MKTVWLMGGLGNQLFQINHAAYISSLGYEVQLNFYLTQRNIVTKLLGWSTHEFIALDYIVDQKFVCETKLAPIILAKCGLFNYYSNFDVDNHNCQNQFGYRQNKELNQKIFFKHKFPQNASQEEFVMHFRAGDMNSKNDAFDYYDKILSKFKSTSIKVITNAVDEFKIIQQRFPNIDFKIQSGSLIDDFSYMLGAKRFIGAPSTLSWWAAKLSQKKELFLPQILTDTLGEVT